jgi:hypothetical protein
VGSHDEAFVDEEEEARLEVAVLRSLLEEMGTSNLAVVVRRVAMESLVGTRGEEVLEI